MSDDDFQNSPTWLRIHRAAQAAGLEPPDPKSEYDAGELGDDNKWTKTVTLPTERASDVGQTLAFAHQNKRIIPKAGLPEGVSAWDPDNGFWHSPEAAQQRSDDVFGVFGMHSPYDEKEALKAGESIQDEADKKADVFLRESQKFNERLGVPHREPVSREPKPDTSFRIRNAGEVDEWNPQEIANNHAALAAIRALKAAAAAGKLKK